MTRELTVFPDRSTLVDKKGLFTKQGARQWQCQCRHPNNLDEQYCANCTRDRRGILRGDITVEAAAVRLRAQVQCLKSALSVSTDKEPTPEARGAMA